MADEWGLEVARKGYPPVKPGTEGLSSAEEREKVWDILEGRFSDPCVDCGEREIHKPDCPSFDAEDNRVFPSQTFR